MLSDKWKLPLTKAIMIGKMKWIYVNSVKVPDWSDWSIWRHALVTDRGGFWCCNILMLMSWLSPQSTCHGACVCVAVSSLILTNTPEYWAQWVWMIVTNELPPPLITTRPHTPSHTLSDPRVPNIFLVLQSATNFCFKLRELNATWNGGLTLILKTHFLSLVWCVRMLLGVIVKDYSWLSRDNKRRRGADTQPIHSLTLNNQPSTAGDGLCDCVFVSWMPRQCRGPGQWRDSSI